MRCSFLGLENTVVFPPDFNVLTLFGYSTVDLVFQCAVIWPQYIRVLVFNLTARLTHFSNIAC